MKTEIIQVLASFVGSFGFAVLYNLRGRKLCMAGISGMVSWIAYLVAWNEMPSVFAANLAAAAVATVYAETMARILKTPVTVFFDHRDHSARSRRKFILHNELCSCQNGIYLLYMDKRQS